MAIVGIPETINDFNLYLTGNKLAGQTGEVQLPSLDAMTATMSGAGILGEYEAPIVGHFGSLEVEVPFHCINEDYFKLAKVNEAAELMLRGAIQYNVKATQNTDYMGMRVVFRGKVKSMSIGTVKQREKMDSKIKLELTFYMIEMDGKERVKLDKLNGEYKINGKDMLAKVKQFT